MKITVKNKKDLPEELKYRYEELISCSGAYQRWILKNDHASFYEAMKDMLKKMINLKQN